MASAVIAVLWCADASASTINVPATGNLWLAGMPDGTIINGTEGVPDVAPQQSPAMILLSSLGSPASLRFSASGGASNSGGVPENGPGTPPEGDSSFVLPYNSLETWGKSSVIAPINSLIGVFLDDSTPSDPTPAALDFTNPRVRNFTALSPRLLQVFWIGDGFNSAQQQDFNVPSGATRLFMGTMDGTEWNNNSGAFIVEITPVPEPATSAMLSIAIALTLAKSRRLARSKHHGSATFSHSE